MKKAPFGGCLWLVFFIVLCSCAIKHSGENTQNYASSYTPSVWHVEVFMMPVKWMPWVSADDVYAAFQPYNIKKTGFAGNTQILQLSFRANNDQQLNTLREQLFATGMVEQVNVTKESK